MTKEENMTELVLFIIGLVTVSAFLSLFEVSIFSCSPIKLAALVEKHPHLKLFSTKGKEVTSAIMVSNIMIDVAGSTYGGTLAYKLFGENIEYTAYTVVITFMLLMFSTLIPKLYASGHASSVLRFFGRLIIGIYIITKPIVSVLYVFVKPFVKGAPEEGITQNEINSVIALAESNKVISDKQSSMINNILSFSQKTVGDILADKRKIDNVDVGSTVSDYEDSIIKDGKHKRYVVTHNYDDKPYPVGIVLYPDLIRAYLSGKAKETRIVDIMHPASITFDDDSALALMDKLDKNIDHITVVVSRDKQEMLGVIQSDDIVRNMIQ